MPNVFSLLLSSFTFLTSTTSGIDTVVIDALLSLMESVLASFKIFPLNLCMGAFAIGIVVGIFRKLKKA